MLFRFKYLFASIVIAFLVCVAQIIGNEFLLLGCLLSFILLIGWTSFQSYTLPILLFFLPWSQLLMLKKGTFTFYTFGLVLVCAIGVFQQRLQFKKYHIFSVFGLLLLTLFSKLLNGYIISFSYIAFMMLLILFPIVKEEIKYRRYDFFQVVVYFSVGTMFAALCASLFASYPNIKQYINIHSYLNIRRTSGFYWDPNFYMAQIVAVFSGCLVLLLKTVGKRKIVCLGCLLFALLYCGFMSGSKTFVLIIGILAVLWVTELLKMKGRVGLRVFLSVAGVVLILYVASSAMFSDLIAVLITRFASVTDLSSFTTKRTDLWFSYIEAILGDVKLALLGMGYTSVHVNDRAAHNTILQIFYQFGIIGTPMLVAWILLFFQDIFKVPRLEKRQMINILMLLSGTFFSWLALDILFFDEFFLLQWFAYMGMQELLWPEEVKAAASKKYAGKYGRLHLKWK